MMKGAYTTIPIGLIQYALVRRKLNHLKVYTFLKCISSGHLSVKANSYKIWAKEIGISEKTLKTCLDWMLKNRWLSFNSKKQSLRVVGYRQLKRKYKTRFHTALKFDRPNFKDFRGLCAAALIGFYRNSKKFFDKKNKVSGLINGTPRKNTYALPKNYYDLPVRYFAECLGVSATTAENLKKEALKFGFITVKKNHFYMEDFKGNKISTAFMEYFDVNKKYFIKSAKGILVKGSDLIKINVHLKRKWWGID